MKSLLVCICSVVICSIAISETLLPNRFAPDQVTLGGEIGRRIDCTINNNLLKINLDDDFLAPFQERTGKNPYIGLGKLIDTFVRFAAYSNDKTLIQRKEYLINETLKTQESNGYIGTFPPENRIWPLWDIHEMSYIVNGLVADYHFFHNETSLLAAQKMMDLIIERWSENPQGMEECPIHVFVAVTGLEEALLMLYQTTGENQYLDFCSNFRELPQWDYPLDLGRWGPIGGHAYAYMHRCLAQVRLHQVRPNPQLLDKSQRVLQFLLNQDGLMINGVCSQHECWHDTQDATTGLGETCSTAYLIRLLDEFLRMEQKSLYGDILERTVLNGLFSAQSPDGRKIRYYVPLESEREYFDGDTYCCPCNYRRIVAELPSMIYYPMNNGVAINLYTESSLTFTPQGGSQIQLSQETAYPNDGSITLKIHTSSPQTFPIYLRIPRWCAEATATIKHAQSSLRLQSEGGRFLTIEREWHSGDTIKLDLPMRWRFIRGRKAQAGRVAIMRGPVLFCLNPDANLTTKDLNLRQIVIDPKTIEGPFADSSVRSNGMSCTIKAWSEMGFSRGGNHDLTLHLTETTDPGSQATYFRIRKLAEIGIEDELVHSYNLNQ